MWGAVSSPSGASRLADWLEQHSSPEQTHGGNPPWLDPKEAPVDSLMESSEAGEEMIEQRRPGW